MHRLPISYLPISDLKPHEAVHASKSRHFNRFAARLKTRLRMKPILVDRATNVILDGHHRFEMCKARQFKRVPCFLVDYMNDATIHVFPRKPSIPVTKKSVIAMGLSGKTYPPKTTKHVLKKELPQIWVDTKQCL